MNSIWNLPHTIQTKAGLAPWNWITFRYKDIYPSRIIFPSPLEWHFYNVTTSFKADVYEIIHKVQCWQRSSDLSSMHIHLINQEICPIEWMWELKSMLLSFLLQLSLYLTSWQADDTASVFQVPVQNTILNIFFLDYWIKVKPNFR